MIADKNSFLAGVLTGLRIKAWDAGRKIIMGLITKLIRANGIYRASDDGADGYSMVDVNVPNSYSAADEGKVVVSGALEAQTSETITQNGVYNTTTNNSVTVNVQGGVTPEPPLPAEYQEVEYIDFTPHCGYLVTIPKTFKMEAKFSPDEVNNAHAAFGYRVSTTAQIDFEILVNQGLARYWMRAATYDPDLNISVLPGDVVVIKGFAYNFRTTAYIGEYGNRGTSSEGFDGKIYYVKGWDINGNLSFKFVPCYRKADDVPGFYDVVADVFYSTLTISSGGSISVGPDAN